MTDLSEFRDAFSKCGSVRGAAKLLGWTRKKARYWKEQLDKLTTTYAHSVDETTEEQFVEISAGRIVTLGDLVERAKIDLSKWCITSYIANCWETTVEGVPTPLYQVKAVLRAKPPELTPATVREVQCANDYPGERPAGDFVLVIPDTQHGFTVNRRNNTYASMHDTSAWAAVLNYAEIVKPTHVVLLGDHLDLAEWSTKYTRGPEHSFTTQNAIQALYEDLHNLREAVGWSCKIHYIEGNHEYRLQKILEEKLPQACELSAANDNKPLFSIQSILKLDHLDISYHGPYGQSSADLWLWDKVMFTHGSKVKSKGGGSVNAVISDATHSVVFGHVHRAEIAFRTIHGPRNREELFAMTPGTLSRIDGAVPPGGKPDWQQGCAVIWRDPATGSIRPRLLRVIDNTVW